MKNFLKYLLSGIGMGIANVIPGLSGGTILVLTGAFEPLTSSISTVLKPHNKKRKQDIVLILEIILGLAIGILLFSFIIPLISKSAFAQLMAFFIGVIFVSCILFYKNEIRSLDNFKWLSFIIGFIICLSLVIFVKPTNEIDPTYQTNPNFVFLLSLVGVGILAGLTMIFPGISGSLLLYMFGMYYLFWGYIRDTVSQLIHLTFNSYMIIPFICCGIGVALGILFGAIISKLFLKKFRLHTTSLIFGLVIGGSAALFPFGDNIPGGTSVTWDAVTIITSILSLVLGIGIVMLIEYFAKHKKSRFN